VLFLEGCFEMQHMKYRKAVLAGTAHIKAVLHQVSSRFQRLLLKFAVLMLNKISYTFTAT